MTITTAQSRLVDEQAKSQFSETYGYDYNANSNTQDAIQAAVEAEIDLAELSHAGDPVRIIPRPTEGLLVNGVRYSPTQQDIDAYAAAHPQNAAIPSEREKIIERLESPQPEPAQIVEEQELFMPFLRYPSTPNTPTHKTISSSPVWAYEHPNWGALHGKLLPNQPVIVTESFVQRSGTLGEFHEIIEEGQALYVLASDLEPILDLSLMPRETFYENDARKPSTNSPKDWTSQPLDVPYYELYNATWRISVSVEHTTVSEQTELRIMEEGFRKGIALILENAGKKSDEDYISQEIEAVYLDTPAQALEWYLPDRQGSKVRVLVSIPYLNVVVLDDAPPSPSKPYVHEMDYEIGELTNLLAKAATNIQNMRKSISNYDGKVTSFDASKEADNLLSIRDDLGYIFGQNDQEDIFSKEGKIRVRWTNDYVPVSVTYILGSNEFPAEKSFREYLSKGSAKSKRTQNLFFNLKQLEVIDVPWVDFLENYVSYKKVKITPNVKGAKESERLKAEIRPPVKTPDDLRRENEIIQDTNKKIERREVRSKQSDYVGSTFIDKKRFPKLAKQLDKGLEDVYSGFLNNVDFKEILLEAAECMISGQVGSTFNKLSNDLNVLKKEKEKLEAFAKEKGGYGNALKSVPTLFYPTKFPTDDISAAFIKALRKSLSAMANQIISTLVQNVLNSLINFCPDENGNNRLPDPDAIGATPPIDFTGLQAKIDELFEGISEEDLSSLFEDLAAILSPEELCSLLEGDATDATLEIVKALLDSVYCHLELETKEQIADFFEAIGDYMDLSVCDELRALQPQEEIVDDFLCPPNTGLREELLKNRGLTPDQVRRQLDAERERARQLAEDFLRQASGDLTAPNLFCSKDRDGNVQEGTVPFMDDQFIYSLRTTIESTFEATYLSFSEEGEAYVGTLFTNNPYEIRMPVFSLEERGAAEPEPPPGFPAENYSVETVAIREPLVNLLDYYKTPVIESINVYEFSLKVPNSSGRSLAALENELRNLAVPNVAAKKCPDDEAPMGQVQGLFAQLRQASALTNTSEVIFTEYPDLCVWKEDRAGQARILSEEAPQAQPPASPPPSRRQVQGELSPCGEPQQNFVPSGPEVQQPPPAAPAPPAPPPAACLTENLDYVGYTATVGKKKLFYKKQIDTADREYLDNRFPNEAPTGINFFKSIMSDAYFNSWSVHNEAGQVWPGGTRLPNRIDLSTFIENKQLFEKTREAVLKQMFHLLMEEGNKSPYLKPMPSTRDPYILNKPDTPEKPAYEAYALDFINLGPSSTPECDPHLLMIRQVMEEIIEEFQKDMCIDLAAEDVPGERPRKSPLEAAMVSAAVKVTLRHYIIETLSTGLITLSSMEGAASKIDDMKFDYILSKMEQKMASYSDAYFREFVTQAVDVYKGVKDADDHGLIIKMLKEEYLEIINGFQDALLLGSGQANFLSKFMDDVLENNVVVFDNEQHRLDGPIDWVNDPIEPDDHGGMFYTYVHDGDTPPRPNRAHISLSLYEKIEQGRAPFIVEKFDHGVTVYLVLDFGGLPGPNPDAPGLGKVSFRNGLGEGPIQSFERLLVPLAQFTYDNTNIHAFNRARYRDKWYEDNFGPFIPPPDYIPPKELIRNDETMKRLLRHCFPIDMYSTLYSIHEMETVSKEMPVSLAFGDTRDNLYSVFLAVLPERDDWKKQDKALKDNGGLAGVKEAFAYNSSVRDIPCTDAAFNFGMDVCWGNPFSGLGLKFIFKAAIDAALMIVKSWIQMNDPNIRLASTLSFLTKLACINVPTSAISGLISASFPFMTTQFTMLYNALGLGLFASAKTLSSDSDEGEKARSFIIGAGLKLPSYCGALDSAISDRLDATEHLAAEVEEERKLNWIIQNERDLRRELESIGKKISSNYQRMEEIRDLQASANAFFANPFSPESQSAASADLEKLADELKKIRTETPTLLNRKEEIEEYLLLLNP